MTKTISSSGHTTISCNGNPAVAGEGHPTIYLEVGHDAETICPYCSAKFTRPF